MGETNISWATHSWNPYTWACERVSPGCANCYMFAMAKQWGRDVSGPPQLRDGKDGGKDAWQELEKIPAGSVIFVNSMSDTYFHALDWGERVPDEWIHRIHNTALAHPDKVFLLLTKRVERMLGMAGTLAWPENLWAGVSVENADYVWRIDYLRKVPAARRFVSYGPALGPLGDDLDLEGIDWLICEGESGVKRRVFDKAWARQARDVCRRYGIPFNLKQGSTRHPGKDRELDGLIYDEFPDFFGDGQMTDRKMTVYTTRVGSSALCAARGAVYLDVTWKSGAKYAPDGLRLLGKSGRDFAPSYSLLKSHKGWDGWGGIGISAYEARYEQEMRVSYQEHRLSWDWVLAQEAVALACYCPVGDFCHRHLLAEMLRKAGEQEGIEVVMGGEIEVESVKARQLPLFEMPVALMYG